MSPFAQLTTSQKLPFSHNFPLVILTALYIISVILFFIAFGIGVAPLDAIEKLSKGSSTTPTAPTEPVFFEPTLTSPVNPPTSTSAFKSLGITFGILSWLLGMGAPGVGLLSYFGIWVGVHEKQFTFVRVVRLHFCFLDLKSC